MQMITYDDEESQIMKIINVSNQILFDKAKGEKKLLALINATVSHEMRNPLNAIYSQNLKQTKLNEEMKNLIERNLDKMSKNELKEKMNFMYTEQSESIKIQISSTKIMTYLVNDMLDFS